jgi:glycosyltransferase involved in cell wall biosynthesis
LPKKIKLGNLSQGISIIICCYNSINRLQPTLHYLAQLIRPDGYELEVLIIDNASTDHTAKFSTEVWEELGSPYPLKVLYESKPGLSFARQCGIKAAQYTLSIFCDDDNWLAPDYLVKAAAVMALKPEVAIACGQIEPVFEVQPPSWFFSIQQVLALGRLKDQSGYVEPPVVPWGAGMVLRTEWVKELGFKSLLSDRVGKQLSSGGDTEICYQFRLQGYKWWYDDELKLQHFITKERIEWDYLKRLYRGFGEATFQIQKYYQAHLIKKLNWKGVLLEEIAVFLQNIVAHLFFNKIKILNIERKKGYLKASRQY